MSRFTCSAGLMLVVLIGHAAAPKALPAPRREPAAAAADFEPPGAEDKSAEDDSPRIPEPMVFDLVRPLGAKRGEFEVNTLGIFPLRRAQPVEGDLPDALGLETNDVEWAPEIEYAIRDGLALEFELPFEGGTLGAYKAAAQWTFGTGFQNHFIHGTQLIVQYDRRPATWVPTLLYLAGVRFDERWSALGMFGLRGDTGAADPGDRLNFIANLSVFADVSAHLTMGLEANFEQTLAGKTALLMMPQVHWEVTDFFMIQGGAGARISDEKTVPEVAARVIRSF